jgi:hypothetical protein
MAMRIKLGRIIFLLILLIGMTGYLYHDSVYTVITGWVVANPVPSMLSEEEVKSYELITEQNDESACMTINDPTFQYDCLSKVAVTKKEIHICEMINDQKSQFGCLSDISLATNDADICQRLESDDYWRDICYKNYALNNNAPQYCLLIPEGIHNNPCYYDIALKYKNWTLCDEVTDTDKNTQCNYILAKELLIKEPCYQMKGILDTEVCLLRNAVYTNNPKVCEEIRYYDTIKQDCLAKFSTSAK